MADVVVFAPHMDDETLGCGGILAQAQDPLVVFAVMSRDEGIEYAEVGEILGFRHEVLYGKEMEARLLSLDRRELVGRLEEVLHRERPDTVFLPSPSYHQDHVALYEAGVAATRPLSREGYIAHIVASYEYPGSVWRHDGFEEMLTYYVDIEDVIETKLAAVRTYASQAGRQAMDPELVLGWARLRGAFIGTRYAEAFRLLRVIEREGVRPIRTKGEGNASEVA
jgi:LmbE family N-acetylglucosaminyl deacetylase